MPIVVFTIWIPAGTLFAQGQSEPVGPPAPASLPTPSPISSASPPLADDLAEPSITDPPCTWTTSDSEVSLGEDTETLPPGASGGRKVVSAQVRDFTKYLNLICTLDAPLDVSGTTPLAFWVKLERTNLAVPLYVVLDDAKGRKRGFAGLVNRYDIEPNVWQRVVLQPQGFQYEDETFDPTDVARVRFGAYHDGNAYGQFVVVHDLDLSPDDIPPSITDPPCTWTTSDSEVSLGEDTETLPPGASGGRKVVSAQVRDFTKYLNLICTLDAPLDVSGTTPLAFWVKLERTNLAVPLYVVLDDAKGRKRGFAHFVERFYMEPGAWVRIYIDPLISTFGDDDFDETRVVRWRFVSFNQGDQYTQRLAVYGAGPVGQVAGDSTASSANEGFAGELTTPGIIGTAAALLVVGLLMGLLVSKIVGAARWPVGDLPVRVVILIALGIAASLIVSFILSMVHISTPAVAIVLVLAIVAVGVLYARRGGPKRLVRRSRRGNALLAGTVITLALLSFSYMILLASDMGWAPAVGAQSHAKYVALELLHGRLPSSTAPVGNFPISPLRYPVGFHALSTSVSLLSGMFPGQAIMVVAMFMAAMLPLLIFVIAWQASRSLPLSVAAALAIALLPGGAPAIWKTSDNLLLGMFLHDAYANLAGNFLLLSFILYVQRWRFPLRWQDALPAAVVLLALLFTYYSLVPFALLLALLVVVLRGAVRSWLRRRRLVEVVALGAVVLTGLLLLRWLRNSIGRFLELDSAVNHRAYLDYGLFSLDSPYVVYGVLLQVAAVLAVLLVVRYRARVVALAYLGFYVPLMLSLNQFFYSQVLWFTQPQRYLILAVVLGEVVIFTWLEESLRALQFSSRAPSHDSPPQSRWRKVLTGERTIRIGVVMVGFVILWSFNPRLTTLLTIAAFAALVFLWGRGLAFDRVRSLARFNRRPLLSVIFVVMVLAMLYPSIRGLLKFQYFSAGAIPRGADGKAMAWLAANVRPGQTVLNDRNTVATWLTGFAAMDVVNDRDILLEANLFNNLDGSYLGERTREANRALDRPWDYGYFRIVARKYNIAYLYVSAASPTVYHYARGIPYGKPYPSWWYRESVRDMIATERRAYFMHNPHLELVYRAGDALVFRVRGAPG